MSTKHGPWKLDSKLSAIHIEFEDGSGFALPAREAARARLIAAAPEMLEILQDSAEIIEVAREAREELIGERDDVIRDLERRIRAVLAKAEA